MTENPQKTKEPNLFFNPSDLLIQTDFWDLMLPWSYVESLALSQGGDSRSSKTAHCVLSSGMPGSCRARGAAGSALHCQFRGQQMALNREELRSSFPSLGFDPGCITCLCNKALKCLYCCLLWSSKDHTELFVYGFGI